MEEVAKVSTVVKPTTPLWVAMPNFVLRYPPIAHRGNSDAGRVTPFEFAVLSGILVAARSALSEQRHLQALQTGAARMQRQRGYVTQFREDWETVAARRRKGASKEQAPAPRMRHTFEAASAYNAENDRHAHYDPDHRGYRSPYRPMKRTKLIKLAGSRGYQQERKRLRRAAPPPVIDITLPSRHALLRFAALSGGTKNLAKLDATLDRLTQPIGDDAGVLVGWQGEGRALRLRVGGEWLAPPFERLPVPLPNSANALALFLFLQGIKTDGRHRDAKIDFAFLCRLLGLPHWSATHANRAINRALDLVNAHLDKVPLATRQKLSWLPGYYSITGIRNAVRFAAEPFDWSEAEEDAMEAEANANADDNHRDDDGNRIVDDDDDEVAEAVPARGGSLPRRRIQSPEDTVQRRPLSLASVLRWQAEQREDAERAEADTAASAAHRQRQQRLAQHRERLTLYEAAAAGDQYARLRLGVQFAGDED